MPAAVVRSLWLADVHSQLGSRTGRCVSAATAPVKVCNREIKENKRKPSERLGILPQLVTSAVEHLSCRYPYCVKMRKAFNATGSLLQPSSQPDKFF